MNTGAPIQTHLVPLPDPDVELLTLPLPTVTPLVKLKVRLLLWLIDGKGWLGVPGIELKLPEEGTAPEEVGQRPSAISKGPQ